MGLRKKVSDMAVFVSKRYEDLNWGYISQAGEAQIQRYIRHKMDGTMPGLDRGVWEGSS